MPTSNIYSHTQKNKNNLYRYLTTDSRTLNVLEAFEFKGLDTFLKEEKMDFISDENILKLGLQWIILLYEGETYTEGKAIIQYVQNCCL